MSEIVEENKNKLDYWIERSEKSDKTIEKYLNEGIPYKPTGDMIVYAQIVTPDIPEEDLGGTDPEVLCALFEGDLDEDVTNRTFTLIATGPNCEKELPLGSRIQVRGHAFKITMPDGNKLFTVREYDVIGYYE